MATIPPQEQILLDLTCPHCQRMNLLAVVPASGASSYVERAVECAHCKKVWEASILGTVVGGPFPKRLSLTLDWYLLRLNRLSRIERSVDMRIRTQLASVQQAMLTCIHSTRRTRDGK
jgi:hypothetical protein